MTDAALPLREISSAPPQEPAGGALKLTAEAQAEVEAKVAEIFRRYGAKLNEAQKAEVRRLVGEAQAPLDALRAFPLENSDEPAAIFRLVRVPSRGLGTTRRAPAARAAAKNPTDGGA